MFFLTIYQFSHKIVVHSTIAEDLFQKQELMFFKSESHLLGFVAVIIKTEASSFIKWSRLEMMLAFFLICFS